MAADDMDDMKDKMKMDFNSYVKQTAQAFTRENTKGHTFQYVLKEKKNKSMEFVWKKHIPAEDITVSYL